MNLALNTNISSTYHSNSQRARVTTENWMRENMFCPICGEEHLVQFEANRPVADFFCSKCRQEYELKSKEALSLGPIIADGAYDTMIERITSNNNPNLFCLTHKNDVVNNLIMIPRYFFTPDIIIKRNPLAETARRAGWTGCNIDISGIPDDCKVHIIDSGIISDKNPIINKYNKIKNLQMGDIESRGWLMDVLLCVNKIKGNEFTSDMIYAFESDLYSKHPNNNNVRAKIRQQLQLLRDRGFIEFTSRGVYRKI